MIIDKKSLGGLPIYSVARRELDKLMGKGGDTVKNLQSTYDIFDILGKSKHNVFKHLVRPEPLHAYVSVLDSVAFSPDRSDIRYVVNVPAQHGKSVTSLIGLLFIMLKNPGSRNLYVTYNSDRAAAVQNDFVEICITLGIQHINATGKQYVRISNGSIIYFRSISTNITGFTCDTVCIMDDLYQGYQAANSETIRTDIQMKVESDVISRSQGGCAFISVGTRFHIDDINGLLLTSNRGFEHILLPALCVDPTTDMAGRSVIDEPLWPARKSLDFLLKERKVNPDIFSCMYQNDPRDSLVTYFKTPQFYHDRSIIPSKGVVYTGGIDCGYSGKGDASVYFEIATHVSTGQQWINLCHREVATLEAFAVNVKSIMTPSVATIRWYGTTIESEASKVLISKGLPVVVHTTTKNKATRAMECYRKWNGGKIVYPDYNIQTLAERVALQRILNFTGHPLGKDDEVDALVAAFDESQCSTPKPFIMSSEDINRLTWNRENMVGISV